MSRRKKGKTTIPIGRAQRGIVERALARIWMFRASSETNKRQRVKNRNSKVSRREIRRQIEES
jgi:hypothetical protein